jgi:hypothetical protein
MATSRSSSGRSSPPAARSRRPPFAEERGGLKKLLATNPNYFGNLPASGFSPVVEIVGNTSYEELTCVGYNPDLALIEATVQIKLPSGFLGDLCSAGSWEYVRFFVDYGSGWIDVGLGSFNAHDLANTPDCEGSPDKPLSYVVTRPIEPQTDFCGTPVLPAVRAILSWQLLPPVGDPNWPPIWGNVLDSHIQINPRPLILADLLKALTEVPTFPLDLSEIELQEIPHPGPPPVTLAELAKSYGPASEAKAKRQKGQEFAVPPHRFGLPHLEALTAGPLQQSALSAAADEWGEIGLDLGGAFGALEQTSGNVSYEELECLGLEYNLERLVATFRVKLSAGYSGELCSAGSQEYVAFWADWDDTCEWTYLGTTSVTIHDFPKLPAGGLTYSAVLPVDLTAIRRPCDTSKIGRIRAVLSWSTPPSTINPDAVPYWGNRIDTHVQVRPGDPIEKPAPIISIIGGVGIADIDVFVDGMTKTTAHYAWGGGPADDTAVDLGIPTRKCPFGGLVIVNGPSFVGTKYRLWARDVTTGGGPISVKNSVWVVASNGVGSWHAPDPVGPGNPSGDFFSYLNPLTQNILQVLSHFQPGGNDLWEVRLELADSSYTTQGFTPWYQVQMDNAAPVRKDPSDPAIQPTIDVWIDTGGGDCADFPVGTLVQGRFVARDPHFGKFTLTTLPTSLVPPPPSPTPGSGGTQTPTFAAGGSPWQLVTTGLIPCGYVILLQVWDRSIVDSNPGHHNYNFTDVGFCLRAPEPA